MEKLQTNEIDFTRIELRSIKNESKRDYKTLFKNLQGNNGYIIYSRCGVVVVVSVAKFGKEITIPYLYKFSKLFPDNLKLIPLLIVFLLLVALFYVLYKETLRIVQDYREKIPFDTFKTNVGQYKKKLIIYSVWILLFGNPLILLIALLQNYIILETFDEMDK